MMRIEFFKYLCLAFLVCVLKPNSIFGNNNDIAHIYGNLAIDSTWADIIYLSYIPSFEKMYAMSPEMIVAKTNIDNEGNFDFNIDFLPCDENLFRFHIVKKGDSPATLIIGGKDENHFFLILNCNSDIHITNRVSRPPFRYLNLENSPTNNSFHQISNLIFKSDSLAAESNTSKRLLIEKQLNENLLLIADTSQNFLVSLFAVYESKFESNYSSNSDFYDSYLEKWNWHDNSYFAAFKKQLPNDNKNKFNIIYISIIGIAMIFIGIYIKKLKWWKNNGYRHLSIQERKIFELLRKGASNQEISDQYNISLSTVKSHVGSIYSKLNIKSRKDIMNLKI